LIREGGAENERRDGCVDADHADRPCIQGRGPRCLYLQLDLGK
jgi:hypothetical protein